MDPLAMLSTGLCVDRCSNIKGMSLQACLLQDCPDVIASCIQAGPTGSSEPVECGDTFTCLFEAITGNELAATFMCTEEASQENLDSAMALLNCVAEQTTDKGTCPWAGANTWVQHVTSEVDCLSGVCGEALYACPVPLLSSK